MFNKNVSTREAFPELEFKLRKWTFLFIIFKKTNNQQKKKKRNCLYKVGKFNWKLN